MAAREVAADTASVSVDDGPQEPGGGLPGGGPGAGGRASPRAARGRVGRGAVRARAGDPRGLLMTKSTIDGVAPLHSVRARERLVLLAAVLEARPGSDHRELARMARQVATLRPA